MSERELCQRDRGAIMQMTVVFIAASMVGLWSLISAGQAWGARRDVQAAASAAARAAAQPGGEEIAGGEVTIDPDRARARAQAVLVASGHSGTVAVSGQTVTVVATGTINYAFAAPGFPASMTATASADARVGVLTGQ